MALFLNEPVLPCDLTVSKGLSPSSELTHAAGPGVIPATAAIVAERRAAVTSVVLVG